MKDEYKILIGAIIVILIVLVGAFMLSGSNNPGPSVSPTAAPVTTTPTVVPGGDGGANGGTPSANPTIVPTAVPTPVPTTEPESGVKLTEFGYWITYPPLGPQNWSSPPPKPSEKPVIQFEVNQTDSVTYYGYYVIQTGKNTGIIKINMTRSGRLSGSLTPIVSVKDSYLPGFITFTYTGSDVFGDSQTKAYANVNCTVNVSELSVQQVSGPYYYTLEIEPSSEYNIGTNSTFTMDIILEVRLK